MASRPENLTAYLSTPAECTDHLARWVWSGRGREGVTSCSCGWVAPSTDSREGHRQQLAHRREALAMEDAAAQAGYIPESWRGGR